MFVKVMRNGKRNGSVEPCSRVTHTYYDKVEYSPSGHRMIQLELSPSGRIIRIPDDGDIVYLMNRDGDTIDKYSYPSEWVELDKKEGTVGA